MNATLLTGLVAHKQNVVGGALRRSVSVAVCLLLVIASVPLGLFGFPEKVSAYSGEGTGTASDPFLITTCEELENISAESVTDNKVFWLADDIDCTGVTFDPITNFYGTLDGRNHTISNLTIDRPSYNHTALFENALDNSLITNLILDDTNTITGAWGTASVVGEASYATLRQVHSAATVITADNMAGGLVGQTHGWEDDMIIEQSSFTGTITSGDYAGGIVGDAYLGYTIRDVLVDADISGYALGGVIGNSEQACGYRKIDRAIVRGTLTGGSFLGGFVGAYNNNHCHLARIQDSVSLATLSGGGANGGAVGRSANAEVTITNTYFDTTAAGTTDCTGTIVSGNVSTCGSIGSNVASGDNPYSTWDFDDLWEVVMGVVQFRVPAALAEGPDSPLNLAVSQGDPSNSINITWEAPASLGSFSLEEYRVEIKKSEDSWDGVRYTTTTGTETNFDALRLGQTYNVRIQAVTAYGGSIWAEEVYSTPDPDVYTASNCEELQDLPLGGGSYLDTYELANDIDCSGVENFEALDWGDSFAGIFDGNGHTISNIQITGEDVYLQGLLRSTNGATVQNLRLEDGVIDLTADSSACGALAGEMYDTNVSAVYVSNFTVTCNSEAGGIAGYVNVGDGDPVEVEVEYVSVIDSIITSNYNRAGGLFGLVEVYEESFLKVMKSYADATVSSPDAAGGLFGRVTVEIEDDSSTPTQFLLQDSYSRGFVSAEYSAGGIIGDAETYNDGYDSIVELELENVYSTAEVEASETYAAGIIGYLDELYYEGEQAVLNNVFAAGSVTATDYDYAVIGNEDFADDDGEYSAINVYYDLTRTDKIKEATMTV